MDIESIANLLNRPQKITIVTHTGPDGDAIGASMGLYHFLIGLRHSVKVIVPTAHAAYLQFLPHNEEILIFENEPDEGTRLLKDAGVIFALDFNTASRAKGMESLLTQSNAVKIMIDHHLLPDLKVDFALWDIKASSTAELVYRFIEMLGQKKRINHHIANCLYTGICSDTGRFKYNLSANAYRITAFLLEKGADVVKINDALFDNFSEDRLRLLGFCITEKLRIFPEYSTAVIWLSKEDLKRFNYKTGDLEGIVNYPLSIADVKFSAMLKETNEEVRLSFRSKGDFAVNEFAAKHYNGGGHKNAAGGNSGLSLSDTLKQFAELLPAYETELAPTIFAV
ncbi:bifunctional oligoribonuclease/PAP phosphatase NrnA [Sphingobacteriales bacterium UPWRP_1]|nr:hypothetical protein BVG80_01060 [Sphingobacteriales bacterium TSM_CSM]PSJ72633.1 bifunctional oligoribonuclease/PAP phosphatase NrnA [Sphingobacteriales bacterium UPWRP_1]